MRWKIRSRRYTDEDLTRYEYRPERMPQPQEHGRWDDVAARLWNEVMEEYPNADRVDTMVLGGEDFTPVGEAFMAWVAGVEGLDTSRRNTRYDLCLIIDETVLQMLVDLWCGSNERGDWRRTGGRAVWKRIRCSGTRSGGIVLLALVRGTSFGDIGVKGLQLQPSL
ncbi:hypothetical protein PG989_002238 [Apiospora arundinis]